MGESPFGSAFSPSGSDMPGDFGGFGSAAAALPEAKSPEDLDAFGFGATTKPQSADAAAVEADEDTEDPFAAPSADKDMKIDTPVSAFPDAGFGNDALLQEIHKTKEFFVSRFQNTGW